MNYIYIRNAEEFNNIKYKIFFLLKCSEHCFYSYKLTLCILSFLNFSLFSFNCIFHSLSTRTCANYYQRYIQLMTTEQVAIFKLSYSRYGCIHLQCSTHTNLPTTSLLPFFILSYYLD